MEFKIEHHSSYSYSASVFLEPHYLYFFPTTKPHIEVIEFELKVTPAPQGCSSRLDAENNVYYQCWFQDKLDRLDITVLSRIKTAPLNPLNFLVDENRESNQKPALQLYLNAEYQLSKDLELWFSQFREPYEKDIVGLLAGLCYELSTGWEHTIRYGEHLMDPNLCFDTRTGSCRDLAWMMIQILRNFRLPSRFVSGYCYNPELSGHELHAWVETWVNGAGWVGLDPTAGLLVTGEYIPVSSSYLPSNTLPVQGTYRGNARSELKTAVHIELL